MTGGGAERQMSYLVNHAASKGYDCCLVTLSGTGNDRYVIDPSVVRIGLDVIVESTGLWNSIQSNRKRVALLREAILASCPTAVVSFCDRMNIMTLAALRGKSRKNIRIAICERSDPRQQKLGWGWEVLRRIYYPRCDNCVVQTTAIANYLKPIVGTDKPIHVIPTAMNSPIVAFRSANERHFRGAKGDTDCPNDPKRLLYVGRLSHEKGTDRLLDVWSQIHGRYPEWRLVIAGEGPEKDRWLRSQVKHQQSSGVVSSIDWLGWVSDIQELMSSCDAFVLPSRYEGFPNALVEAMDSNLPCVATDCSASIVEIIPDSQTGMRVSNDSVGLAAGVELLLSDEALRDQFREKAKLSVAKFSWPAVSTSWDSVLVSLTNRL